MATKFDNVIIESKGLKKNKIPRTANITPSKINNLPKKASIFLPPLLFFLNSILKILIIILYLSYFYVNLMLLK
ncbi:hypothetical protein rsdtw13_14770 [Clostridium sp. TW13]|uniref:Uncharacterized protein n=1 Tax=Inconstantimicrobium mannanitabidum TaxID=1604901 RepID=A0ACB5RBG7_9CLOT|nr:hypothetical protein rsdtw13_14770 [Clostridium sp. TW13]